MGAFACGVSSRIGDGVLCYFVSASDVVMLCLFCLLTLCNHLNMSMSKNKNIVYCGETYDTLQ